MTTASRWVGEKKKVEGELQLPAPGDPALGVPGQGDAAGLCGALQQGRDVQRPLRAGLYD